MRSQARLPHGRFAPVQCPARPAEPSLTTMLNPELFGDLHRTRTMVRIIGAAMALSAGVFAFVVDAAIAHATPTAPPPQDDLLKNPWLGVCVALALMGNLVGARVHAIHGSMAYRTEKSARIVLVTLGMCEAATLIGLVHVMLSGSWDVKLAPIIGAVAFILAFLRSEVVFRHLIRSDVGPAEL